ncbi:MAG: hypothetical protein JRJ87_03740 [Deltaproteobacteria bacterium]|nr:hypothetical protein [Deltaproteobacteria bacterium]
MKSTNGPMTKVVISLFLLSIPASSYSAEPNFAAKVEALKMLLSGEIVGELVDCLAGVKPQPERLTLEIEVAADGSAGLANVAPDLLPKTRRCLNDLISRKTMPRAAASYRFTQQIAWPPKVTGDKAPGLTTGPGQAATPVIATGEVSGINYPDAGRIVFLPTAIPRPQGVFNATAHDIGFWQLEYGLSDQVGLGLQVLLPITVVALAPGLRLGFRLSDNVWLGGSITAGFFIPYIDGVDVQVLFYGGGPSLTLGNDRFIFNCGLMAMGATLFADSNEGGNETEALLLPHLGISVRLSEMVRFNLEVTPPLLPTVEGGSDAMLWLVLYGIRIHGEMLYGDISFVWPAGKDTWTFMKYMPMGLPLLSFGFQI